MILLSEEDGNRSHITTTTPMDVNTNITTLEEDRGPELEPFTKDGCSCAAVEEGCSCTPTNENKEIEITYDNPKQWSDNFRSDAVRCKLVERGPQTVDLNSFKFPCTYDGRHFSRDWFFKTVRR